MSALKPKNEKYRRSWLTWGRQMIPSEQYKDNFDKISWGKSKLSMTKEELTSPLHYRLRFKTSG
jgi:hypothetical protein